LAVHLDVVGEGPDLEACRTVASDLAVMDRVTFHGRQTREEVDAFYQAADIFLFPSYREPGGNVQFEAMGHGLPLVVSTRGGTAAAVDATCAMLVEPREPWSYSIDLAASVRTLVEDPLRRREMGSAARSRAEAIGLWEPKIDRMGDIYREIIHV
jgi:glycosyltransferase involved in cell wall biosynthesis